MTKDDIRILVLKLVGDNEQFAHDPQVSECSCHKETALYKAVTNRNTVRDHIRQSLEEALQDVSD